MRRAFSRCLFAGLLGVLAISGAAAQTTADAGVPTAVAPSDRVVRSVTIRSAPTIRSRFVARLIPGQSLPVVSVRPAWIEVRLADGTTGWVSRRWTVVSAVATTETAAGPFTLDAIDVGTGLALLVRGPDFALLYDGGSNDDTALGDRNRLIAFLRAVHPDLRRIDAVVLSHPHRDHVELLADVLARYEVGSVWDSGRVNPICGYRAFIEAIASRPATSYHDAVPGEGSDHEAAFPAQTCRGARLPAATVTIANAAPIDIGRAVSLGRQATMTVLAADGSPLPDVNANSVVVTLLLGARRVLLMGDAEAGGRRDPLTQPDSDSIEGRLLHCCRSQLAADVMVVGHHGSRTSSRATFIDAVGAGDYVVSAGPTRYASVVLPDAEVVAELEARGRLWRTDRDDAACGRSSVKVGQDADGQPGGCDNIRLVITDGQVTGEYIAARPEW